MWLLPVFGLLYLVGMAGKPKGAPADPATPAAAAPPSPEPPGPEVFEGLAQAFGGPLEEVFAGLGDISVEKTPFGWAVIVPSSRGKALSERVRFGQAIHYKRSRKIAVFPNGDGRVYEVTDA